MLISLLSKAPGQRPDAAALARQLAALLQDPAPPDRPVLTVTAPAATPPPPFTVTLVRPGTRIALSRARRAQRPGALGGVQPGRHHARQGCDQGTGPDGSLVQRRPRVRLLNVASRTCTATLAGPQGAASSVAFSPDGTILASGNSDQPVHLWRLTGRFRSDGTTLADDTDVMSVAFSPDGGTLATGNCYKTVRLWDLRGRTCVATLTGHGGRVHSVAFGPDAHAGHRWQRSHRPAVGPAHSDARGHADRPRRDCPRRWRSARTAATLASGSVDTTIRLWDVASQTCAAELTDSSHPVFCVAFSPDGATLASGGLDATVRLWDVATRTCADHPHRSHRAGELGSIQPGRQHSRQRQPRQDRAPLEPSLSCLPSGWHTRVRRDQHEPGPECNRSVQT